jgi:predicted secreted protein
MMMRRRIAALAGMLAAFSACSSTQWQSPSPDDPSDTADIKDTPVPSEEALLNSVDNAYRYVGTVPCPDCDGIRMDLFLFMTPDGQPKNFELQETHLGTADGVRKHTTKGDWKTIRGSAADPTATIYEFESDHTGPMSFLVLGNKHELRLLDRSRVELDTPLPHSLTRVDRDALAPLVLTPEPPGRDVDLVENQLLIIRLPADRSRWSMADSTQSVVKLQGDPDYVPDSPGSSAGGGTEIWRFKATREGEQTLAFVHRNPGEPPASSDETITIVVKVKE